jgi:serine/threonine-protein kinase
MALLGAVLWVVATVLFHIAVRAMSEGLRGPTQATDAIAAVSAVVSLSLFFYIRKSNRSPEFILNLGQVFLVYTALALGLMMHWYPPANPPADHVLEPMITWIGVVILMSSAIVPNAPSKTLVVGLIAASMNPVSMLIGRAAGVWDFPAASVLIMHYPDYLLVGVSVVVSLVVTRLGQQVTKAREMGSYQLIDLLGRGGMGEVWRARHRMLARDAAIKLIQPDVLSRNSGQDAEMMRRRFEQEAQSTASLRSPHTVALYDYGVTEDGVFYYVMELLDGIDLETLVKKFGPQPPARWPTSCIRFASHWQRPTVAE